MLKKDLRKNILTKRKEMGESVRKHKSEQVVAKILESPLFQEAQVIFSFVSFGHEVKVDSLIDEAVRLGKKVVIPKTDMKKKELVLCSFEGWDKLISGVFGILEPVPGDSNRVNPNHIDLVIMPGVAFDQRGGRLGYGGGFYDRFLAGLHPCPPLLVPCFSEQLVDVVPTEDHDIKVDYIFTERKVIQCEKTKKK